MPEGADVHVGMAVEDGRVYSEMEVEIEGRLKYLVIGLVFMAVSLPAGYLGWVFGPGFLLPIAAGLFVLGALLAWTWWDMRRHGIETVGELDQIPKAYNSLIGGVLFFYVGMFLLIVGFFSIDRLPDSDTIAYVFKGFGLLCVLIGLPILVTFLRCRLAGVPIVETKRRLHRMQVIIGTASGASVLLVGIGVNLWLAVTTGDAVHYYIAFGLLGLSVFVGGIFFVLYKYGGKKGQ